MKDVALQCNSCEVWFCYQCLLEPEKLLEDTSIEIGTDMIIAICKECRKLLVSTSHKKSLFSVVAAKNDVLAEKLNNTDKEVDES